MTDNDFKELNIYLNEVLMYLERNEPFLLDNLIPIIDYSDYYLEICKDKKIRQRGETKYLDIETLWKYSIEILESINPNYAKKFIEYLNNGVLDYSDSLDSSKAGKTKEFYTVNIKRNYDYSDIIVSIHEFFHLLNNSKLINRNILTEFISIYFEFYAYDYLVNKNVEIENQISERIFLTYNNIKYFNSYSLELLLFKNVGFLDSDIYKYLDYLYNYNLTKEEYIKDCKNLLKRFKKIENDYKESLTIDKKYNIEELKNKLSFDISTQYRYIIGTLFALYMRKHGSLDKMVWLNENINVDPSIGILQLLSNIGLDLNSNEIYNKIFESLNDELNITEEKIR